MFAGTSTKGMQFAEASPRDIYDWDYVIVDGHLPVVSGTFDYNWRYASSLSHAGDD
jgi:hypothetical protein